jgi:hypothetical protein
MIKALIYNIFGTFINLSLCLIKEKNKSKLIYNTNISFGESFIFNLLNYDLIINNKKKLLIFSNFEKKIAQFFFNKDHIYKPIIILPKFLPIYPYNKVLKKKLNTRKNFQTNFNNKIFIKKHRLILENILRERFEQITSSIKFFQKKKFILIFIKHYNKNCYDIKGSQSRQTSNLTKVFLIIKFILKKKLRVVVMGSKEDKSVNIIKNHFKNKNLFFFKNLSQNQSLIDQLFLHKYCQFGIGSDSGAWTMSFFFQKKLFLFDSFFSFANSIYKKYKNILFMPKKITYGKKTFYLSDKILSRILKNKIAYTIHEVSFDEIINPINKYLRNITQK